MSGKPASSTDQGAENAADEVGEVAGRFRSFVASHGGGGTAVVQYLGRPGARIVLVAADGAFADAVVSSMDLGRSACAAARIPVSGWERELTSRITISGADRRRMAGTGR